MILYSPMHFTSNINRFIITVFIIFNSFSAYSANTGHDEYSERNEADSFIAHMPEKLQERQTEAIRKAMSGNNDLLLNVRNARNTAAKLPNSVYRTACIFPWWRLGYRKYKQLFTLLCCDGRKRHCRTCRRL